MLALEREQIANLVVAIRDVDDRVLVVNLAVDEPQLARIGLTNDQTAGLTLALEGTSAYLLETVPSSPSPKTHALSGSYPVGSWRRFEFTLERAEAGGASTITIVVDGASALRAEVLKGFVPPGTDAGRLAETSFTVGAHQVTGPNAGMTLLYDNVVGYGEE